MAEVGNEKKTKKTKKEKIKKPSFRLYEKGIILGYKRSQRTQHPNFALVTIRNVKTKKDAQFYVGKKVAYIYKGKSEKPKKKKIRCIWGKINKTHGNSGVVRVRFTKPIPATSFGKKARIMLYPSNI